MKFTPSFLDHLRQRLPLSQVIGARVVLKKMGTTLKGLCPFHKEKTPSFTVNDVKGFYHCFGCGARGDLFDFLIQTEGVNFPEAVEKVSDLCGVSLPASSVQVGSSENTTLPNKRHFELLEESCKFFQSHLTDQIQRHLNSPVVSYLGDRKITPQSLETFRLGYAPSGNALQDHLVKKGFKEEDMVAFGLLGRRDSGKGLYPKFRHRLIFPIFDRRGRVIGFGGRLLGDGTPKYLNSSESILFHKRQNLYGLCQALRGLKENATLLVCEGYMDVISLHQAGFKGAVASLGTAMGEEQLQEVWRLCSEPVLCFDGDASGREAALKVALKALPFLIPGRSLQFVLLPPGEDPDSLMTSGRRDLFSDLLSQSLPLSQVLWQWLWDKANPTTPERQALLRQSITQLTALIQEDSVRSAYNRVLKETFYKIFHKRPHNVSGPASSSPFRNGFRPPEEKKLLGFSRASENKKPVFSVSLDSQALQRKILLAMVINHPYLLEGVFEEFVGFSFSVPILESIRTCVVEYLENNHPLDAVSLKTHLYTQGYGPDLEALLKPDLYVHARFASPESSPEDALEGWKEVYTRMIKTPQASQDLLLTRQALAQNMDQETWNRLKMLTNLMVNGEGSTQ